MLKYGVCEQLITDKGNEWLLCAFAQHYTHLLAGRPYHTASVDPVDAPRLGHRFTYSDYNTRAERFNFEPNIRVQQYVRPPAALPPPPPLVPPPPPLRRRLPSPAPWLVPSHACPTPPCGSCGGC